MLVAWYKRSSWDIIPVFPESMEVTVAAQAGSFPSTGACFIFLKTLSRGAAY